MKQASLWRGALSIVASGTGALVAAVAAGCCAATPALGALAAAVGLSVLRNTEISIWVLAAAATLFLLGLWPSYRRHRSALPVIVGVAGVVGMLVPFRRPMEVWLFQVLLYGGIALVLGAAGLNLALLLRRRSRASRSWYGVSAGHGGLR